MNGSTFRLAECMVRHLFLNASASCIPFDKLTLVRVEADRHTALEATTVDQWYYKLPTGNHEYISKPFSGWINTNLNTSIPRKVKRIPLSTAERARASRF